MPETEFTSLVELGREDAPGRNGTDAPGQVPTLPSLGKDVRSKRRAVDAGRQVNPTDLARGWMPQAEEPRQYGRDKEALDALKAIADFDPQASEAVWNFLRLLNPGHHLNAYVGDGSDETLASGPAQAYLDDLAKRVGEEYGGGLDQFHNVLSLLVIIDGAVAAEVAPTFDLRGVEDWYAISPILLSYKRTALFPGDEIGKLHLGQRKKDGTWAPVNELQVFYQPLDPWTDDPYGRPPFMASMQTILSKSIMLNDLRAVAHNQGYPRIDVQIVWQELIKAAPPQLRDGGKEADLVAWMQRQLSNIVSDYNDLNVDDTFVHYDWVKIGMVGPSTPGTAQFDFKALESILTRQINSALKSLPVMLGVNETTSETHGSIQWQIQVAGIEALRRIVKRIIEKLANASLQIAGIQAHAKMDYTVIRTEDRKYEADANLLEVKALEIEVRMGWKSNDEAAMERTGHEAVEEPLFTGQGAGRPDGTPDETVEEPGGAASVDLWRRSIERQRPLLEARLLRAVADEINDQVEVLAVAGGVFFMQARDVLIEQLRAEGYEFDQPRSDDVAKDVADYVFGLRFSRQMKGLLRQAIERGLTMAGLDQPEIPSALVERIWRSNLPFVRRIREDLKAQLRAGAFKTIDDVDRWFSQNVYRETLMGRFLARQGLNAGYGWGIWRDAPATLFVWTLGDARHCGSCQERAGQTYSYADLEAIGFPGSLALECGANCKCSEVESA